MQSLINSEIIQNRLEIAKFAIAGMLARGEEIKTHAHVAALGLHIADHVLSLSNLNPDQIFAFLQEPAPLEEQKADEDLQKGGETDGLESDPSRGPDAPANEVPGSSDGVDSPADASGSDTGATTSEPPA